jgi:thiol:disulfide interchange protein DsbD
MKFLNACLLFLAAALWARGLPAGAGSPVQATLVAADLSVQPGRPVVVALHFVHQPHWHTYWSYPGTGLATALTWTLPPGWKAGAIQWPAPKLLKDSRDNVVGNGYDGDLLLPVVLTPPAGLKAGGRVALKASVDWLMCADECVPGSATLSLDLPVRAEPPAADPRWGPRIRAVLAGLPAADPAWTVTASRTDQAVTLKVAAKAGAAAGGAARGITPTGVRFFSDDGFIAYDQPQSAKPDGAGGFVLALPIGTDGPKDPARLSGVVTSDSGWRTDGSLAGLKVDVPLAVGSAPAGTPSMSAPGPAAAPGTAPVANEAAAPRPAPALPSSLAATLLLALIGGLILNLMPCVFPVLGLKILSFVNQAGHERGKVAAHGLVFSAGVLASFWALAGSLAVLRAGGDQLGWGFQLQSPAFVFALAAVMLVFALNMSGVFEFGLSATSVGSGLQSRSGLAGSFFTGVLATVVATPCSAPFLAPALGAALALPVVQSFAIFTAIAVGLSLPYLLLSIFPAAVKALPRPGAWMETFKQVMAFPLYATVAYLLWVLAGQATENGLLSAFLGLVLVAMGIWCYGHWHTPGASPGRARFGLAGCALLLAAGAWAGWPRTPAATDVVWEKWSPETVDRLRAEGRMVYVDFTARWCATCQANKRIVFHSGEVLRAFRDEHIVALRGDWTNRDPAITAELAKYQRSAVPFDLVWRPDRAQPVILPELLAPALVLRAIRP